MADHPTDRKIVALIIVVAVLMAVAFYMLGDDEPMTRSGPFWRPNDWERRHGGLGEEADRG